MSNLNEPERKPALTVVVQSWATPLIGLLMLVVGLAAGFYARPLFTQQEQQPQAAATLPPTSAVAVGESVATVEPTADPTAVAESQKGLMDFLTGQMKHFRGDPNAPVTIIEFSDFQWPYCGRWAADAERQIEAMYVANGKVRLGYFHYAFLGQESLWAAEASECAGDQDQFWEYHDYLFSHQNGENQGAFSKDNLKAFAVELGLDATAFNECMDTGKYTEEVQQMSQIARQIGVQSTPSFAINGQALVGAQPFDTFQQIIEGYLSGQ